MKKILFTILVLCSLCAAGQNKKAAADDLYYNTEKNECSLPKKANTIIITDTLSQQQFYNTITEILFESGYGLLSSDKTQGTITTSDKAIKTGTVNISFLIKNNRVIMRGNFRGPGALSPGGIDFSDLSIIEYKGMNGSIAKNAWDEMKKIADQIPGQKKYLKN